MSGELSRAGMDVIENKRDIDDVMDLYIVNVKRALNIFKKIYSASIWLQFS